MLAKIKGIPLFTVLSLLPLFASAAPARLTDIRVFSAQPDGTFGLAEVWGTRPAGNFVAWMQQGESGGPFVNGPTDANAQPNISLTPGATGYRLLGSQAASERYTYFGINLFFNGSTSPSISAYGPELFAPGPSSFSADSSTFTPAADWSPTEHAVPGAGTLSCVIGDQQITLTDFFWAAPSVYGLDSVGQYSTGPDGSLDYVGGISLSVTTVPEPGSGALLGLAFVGYLSLRRRCHDAR
jgi:hypothetical protein